MNKFAYRRATTLAEAVNGLEEDEDAKLLAGGMTLLPTMKQRLASPSLLIDIARLPELAGIRLDGGRLVIGAGVRHADVAGAALVRESIPALAELAGLIGDPHVRHRGTLGGSIANNDPSADYPAACLGLAATVVTTERTFAADDFFIGLFETALRPNEIVTSVSFPVPARAGYSKFPNPASGYAMVGVFVAETVDGPRVAVTGAGSCAFRHTEMEAALSRRFGADAVKEIETDPAPLTSDLHESADYRAALVTVMAARAVSAAR